MKLIKPFVFTVFAAGSLIVCGSAFAQASTDATSPTPSTNAPPTRPHGQGKFRGMSTDRLAEILNLTDAQKEQVRPILKAEGRKMRDLHNDTSLSADDRRSKMKEILNDTSAQLQSILTPEQLAKWHNLVHGHHSAPKATPAVSTNAPAGS